MGTGYGSYSCRSGVSRFRTIGAKALLRCLVETPLRAVTHAPATTPCPSAPLGARRMLRSRESGRLRLQTPPASDQTHSHKADD
jgi:hypothetical protein